MIKIWWFRNLFFFFNRATLVHFLPWKILCIDWNHIFQVKTWWNFSPQKNIGWYREGFLNVSYGHPWIISKTILETISKTILNGIQWLSSYLLFLLFYHHFLILVYVSQLFFVKWCHPIHNKVTFFLFSLTTFVHLFYVFFFLSSCVGFE